MNNFYPKNGMTVAALKAIIKDWPERNAYTGEENEVWISTGDCLTSYCGSAEMLNYREHEGEKWADLLLTSYCHMEVKE